MRKTGIKFFEFLRPRGGEPSQTVEVSCRELLAAAAEYNVRELAFWTCVNMMANAIGRCEFRTFEGGEEVRGQDYYLWNIEPSVNQNSSQFLHKLVAKLCQDGEALVINPRQRDEHRQFVVADSWSPPETAITRMTEYRDVTVGNVTFRKTFREDDVIHLRLNHLNLRPVLDGLYQSYYKMVEAAMKAYLWGNGQHWKLHINRMPQGDKEAEKQFNQIIQDQVKPFLESNGAVLPEFDGYEYTNVGTKEGRVKQDTRDIKALVEDIFDFNARGFLIPAVLVNGKVEATADANHRFLSYCIDPICDQLQEEINRKCYGYERWRRGDFLRVDSSSILHFDLFANAANIEKLMGCGYSYNDIQRSAGGAEIDEPWANAHVITKNFADAQNVTNGGDEP